MEKSRAAINDIGGVCRLCHMSYDSATKDKWGNIWFICPQCKEDHYSEPKPSFGQRVFAFLTKRLSV